ncbi:MAG: DUF3592 domain-containing protein [Akkermansiaceae bacterium]|nr:DUF3592 domain-containing protein [Akkermansiaceae bacterium]
MSDEEQEAPVDVSSDGGKLTTLGVFLLIGGVVLIVSGIVAFARGDQAQDWNVVDGRIISSEVVRHTKVRNDTFSGHEEASNRYRAEVVYEYTHDGRRFTGDRVSRSDPEYPLQSQAEEVVDRYPVGKDVEVHYDPGDPGTAVLEIGTNRSVGVQLGLGALCLGLGSLLAIAGRF